MIDTNVRPRFGGKPIDVRILAPGTNWIKIGGMLAHGLTGYHSELPEGSNVAVYAGNAGKACLSGPVDVDAGKYDFGISSPPWLVRTAVEGRGALGFGQKQLNLRAVAVLPHFDQLALAVRKDLGVRSIRELKERKIPLNISTAPLHLDHPAGWVLDLVLAEYGMEIEDFARWGGSVNYNDRSPNFMEKVPAGNLDRVSSMKNGTLNAVFDEALMTVPWRDIADSIDLTFLSIDEDVLATLDRKYGVRSTVIPKGRLRGIDQDIRTVEFSGWFIYCRTDVSDDLVYLLLKGLEQQKMQIESMFQESQGLTSKIELSDLWRGAELPLHRGAQRFYEEKGAVIGR